MTLLAALTRLRTNNPKGLSTTLTVEVQHRTERRWFPTQAAAQRGTLPAIDQEVSHGADIRVRRDQARLPRFMETDRQALGDRGEASLNGAASARQFYGFVNWMHRSLPAPRLLGGPKPKSQRSTGAARSQSLTTSMISPVPAGHAARSQPPPPPPSAPGPPPARAVR
jgi:hypothetical protein